LVSQPVGKLNDIPWLFLISHIFHSLDVIKRLNYTAPTAIQAQAIPAIMSGRDVIGVAKTGSGKTIAFLLPLFRHIKDQRPLEQMDGPLAIGMTPTRELAVQIHRECKPFLRVMNLRVRLSRF
jgi:ATP-dependent RNA helicase DDX46/PRP5